MAYEGGESEHCAAVERAMKKITKASLAHQRGGSVEALNRAYAEEADARARWREFNGGNLYDDR